MFTTGVSKMHASMLIVEATLTTTSAWHSVSPRCRWCSGITSIARPSATFTVSRNGFSMITCGMPANSR